MDPSMMPPHIRAEFIKHNRVTDPVIIRDLRRADKEREAAAKIIVTDPTQIFRDLQMSKCKDPGVAGKEDGEKTQLR